MKQIDQKGITLLVALLLMGVLLGVSASLLNITLKQYQLSGVSYASEIAFQAANAGMECALYHDWVSGEFDLGDTRDATSCFGTAFADVGHTESPVLPIDNRDSTADSGEEQRFRFNLGSPSVCSEFSVYKFAPGEQVSLNIGGTWVPLRGTAHNDTDNACPDPEGARDCTVIQSRGYNVSCGQIESGARVVEREYTQIY